MPSRLSVPYARLPRPFEFFQLFLGFTTQEFAASSIDLSAELALTPLSNGRVKSMEAGRRGRGDALETGAKLAAVVIDRAIRGALFPQPSGDLRYKITKPDTIGGWETVRKYATENVPFPMFLHQRHYGGAYRQLLDATSGRRGGVLEDAVRELFTNHRIPFIRTGQRTKKVIADRFNITVTPAPDFVIYDRTDAPRAFLECKQANDGGTARDKASRFSTLRREGIRSRWRSRIRCPGWARVEAYWRYPWPGSAGRGWSSFYGQNLSRDDVG